jgi:hypothetical protein
VTKQVDKGWRVYDTFDGSYPYQKPGLGVVAQDQPTEAEAQAEADRANKLHFEGKVPARGRETKQQHSSIDDDD